MAQLYNDPAGVFGAATASTIGTQIRTDKFEKKALIEAAKKAYFGQMSGVANMPKNMGKTIKKFHYLPMLDDANINDQGIDAAGLSTTMESTIVITKGDTADTGNGWVSYYAVGEGADAAAALAAAKLVANDIFTALGVFNTDYNTTKAAVEALVPAWSVDDTITAVPESGNLYGSSKDVGTIASKLPALSEVGGRVNRVGFKRIQLEGSLEKFGFFDEYTQESRDFDSDAELSMHVHREMINAANEMTEDALQIDLLNSAGVVFYGGSATSKDTITGVTASGVSLITYEDLMKFSIVLDDNRCPKDTKLIKGSKMTDTRTIYGARYLYTGSESLPMYKRMTDLHSERAYIPVHQYADAGNVARGEQGSVDQFRIIVVPEMMHWAGAGAAEGTNAGYRTSGGNYNVYPSLVVGDGSFTTIGFQTDGKNVKFTITHKKPGKEIADLQNPYGELGFMSIKWYYGFLLERPERIGLLLSVAEY